MNALLRWIGRALALGLLGATASPLGAQPWAPGQEPASPKRPAPLAEARALERLRRDDPGPDLRRRYLQAAHALLQRYWNTRELPRLLLAGDAAQGCGAGVVGEPMAYYCPQSLEIAMALDLGRSLRSARGKTPRELLLLELAVLAHEWGHHVNREQGRGPYGGGLGLTVRQEELAADWRTGMLFGWLLREGVLDVDAYTQTANLMFELGDYERITPQHHGYPKDRFAALSQGMATQLSAGQQLGSWSVDTSETFSQPLPGELQRYAVRRFEIDRGNQIATNLIGGLLGAASCIWGSQQQCLGMALEQGKGRAEGTYTSRILTLDCASGRFDVSGDDFGPQPISRDGKGQAAVLAARDCPRMPGLGSRPGIQ